MGVSGLLSVWDPPPGQVDIFWREGGFPDGGFVVSKGAARGRQAVHVNIN